MSSSGELDQTYLQVLIFKLKHRALQSSSRWGFQLVVPGLLPQLGVTLSHVLGYRSLEGTPACLGDPGTPLLQQLTPSSKERPPHGARPQPHTLMSWVRECFYSASLLGPQPTCFLLLLFLRE